MPHNPNPNPDELAPTRAGARARMNAPQSENAPARPVTDAHDAPARVRAFAPGRVNLIGEHTDYNDGLALAFAIAEGVAVDAQRIAPEPDRSERVLAFARDFGEHDEFALSDPQPTPGWRAYVRGTVAELQRAGLASPVGASLRIEGGIPRGAGLSSSAAMEVALSLALLALAGTTADIDQTELAQLCARVENTWAGAQTGLLDQLASLYGERDTALRIDFHTLRIDPIPLGLNGWRLVSLDSGERRRNANSGYNQRRAECMRACELLGIRSLREASWDAVAQLPAPLQARARHVLSDNERVDGAVAALRAGDLPALGGLLNASHASLRDDLQVSTPAVETTVARMLDAGAAGARLLGGGFGGSVLGLLPPDVPVPDGGFEVRPCAGARVLEL
jgi:galactokinase